MSFASCLTSSRSCWKCVMQLWDKCFRKSLVRLHPFFIDFMKQLVSPIWRKHLQCKIANLSYSEGINQSTCAYIPTYINIHVYIHCVYAFLAWTIYRRNIFFFNERTIWLWEKPLPTPYLSTENHFVLPGWHNSVSLRASLFCRSDKYGICQVTKSPTLT